MTPLDHALQYAGLGWRVAPIPAGQKYPGRNDWQEVASNDPAIIGPWWSMPGMWRHGDKMDSYGVCVVTGIESGIFVLDIDPRHGGDDTLADLEHEHGALPDTVECLTGGGGRHLYFKMPDGHVIGNDQSGRLGPGLDVRGEGGQVVAPPTIHPETQRPYEWEAMGDPLDGVTPAVAPAWLVELLTREPERAEPRKRGSATSLSDRPGDRFEEETEWSDLLTGDGWSLHSTRNGRDGYYELWTRPGKLPKDGASASLYYAGSDVLKVFTPNTPGLTAERTYDRFGYYTATRHGGDHSAAARALGQQYNATQGAQPIQSAPIQSASGTSLPTAPTPMSDPSEIEEWEQTEPIPLGDVFDRPRFPIEVFPQWIAEQVVQVAEELQIEPDLPAQLAVTALSIAVASRAHIQVNGPWTEPLNTYMVTALPPGAGKSPAFRSMLAPLEDHEVDLAAAAAESFNRVKLERDMIEADLEKAKRKGERAEALAFQDQLAEKPLPVIPRLMVDDVTPEKLGEMLAQQSGRLALVSTEGGLFSMMTGRYSNSSNLDLYLQAWSQDTVRIDRVSGRELVIRRPTLTIGLTVQPNVIAALAERPELAGRGVTARFMYSVPHDTRGTRDLGRHSTWSDPVASMYGRQLLGVMAQVERDFHEADDRSVAIRMSTEARAAFLGWRQDHERRLAPDGDLRFMAEWVTKLQSTTARLAGLLHLAGCSNPYEPVSLSTMDAAIRVGNYWEAHARIAHDLWGSDEELTKARKLIDWVLEAGLTEFSTADVQRALRRVFEKVEQMSGPLNILIDRGWLRPLFEGALVLGQRGKAKRFAVNPTALVRYREHCERSDVTESDEVSRHTRHVLRGTSEVLSLSPTAALDAREPANGANGAIPDFGKVCDAGHTPEDGPDNAITTTPTPTAADIGLF